jgi:hypothetical protein
MHEVQIFKSDAVVNKLVQGKVMILLLLVHIVIYSHFEVRDILWMLLDYFLL